MRRTHLLIAAIAAALACVAFIVLSLRDGAPDKPAGLRVVGMKRLDTRLIETTLRTPALEEETHVRVLLPAAYRHSTRRYPVLYLLHGAGTDYRLWTDAARDLTDALPLIVVMPDGDSGFYSDWYNGGEGGPPMWERYHIDELIPWIDAEFRTRDEKGGRAIAGSSMGGFGALSYAGRHPDLFAAAASFSGPVDTSYPPVTRFLQRLGVTANGEPPLWGARSKHPARWRAHNPVGLAERLRSVRVLLFTGNGKPGGPLGGPPSVIEALVHVTNLRLHSRLLQLGIPHLWQDYGPGAHRVDYFERDLALALPRLMRAVASRDGAVTARP